jgi:type III restriction enzyme
LPQEVELHPTTPLLNRYHQPLQKSLFDFVPVDSVNTLEKNVVYFLEDQDKLYFWYRNIVRNDYGLQAWRKDKIYADFIFTIYDKSKKDVGKVYVLETKGEHLAGNRDTEYKRSVFDLCNQLLKRATLSSIKNGDICSEVEYKVVTEDEWQRELRNVFVSV